MSKLNYVMGMLAAGGAVAATGADATITYTLNLPITSDATTTSITLLGAATPQYDFGSFANATTQGSIVADSGLISHGLLYPAPTKSDIGLVVGYTVGGAPLTAGQFKTAFSANPMTLLTGPEYPVADVETGPDAVSPPGGTDHYAYLLFDTAPHSPVFFGYAHFSADNTLETITVDVPEPQTWALLLSGVGLVGGALRQGRRRRAVIAA